MVRNGGRECAWKGMHNCTHGLFHCLTFSPSRSCIHAPFIIELRMLMALLETPVSGCTCLSTLYRYSLYDSMLLLFFFFLPSADFSPSGA